MLGPAADPTHACPRRDVSSPCALQGPFSLTHDVCSAPRRLLFALPRDPGAQSVTQVWQKISILRQPHAVQPCQCRSDAIATQPCIRPCAHGHAWAWALARLQAQPTGHVGRARSSCLLQGRDLGRRICLQRAGNRAEGNARRIQARPDILHCTVFAVLRFCAQVSDDIPGAACQQA